MKKLSIVEKATCLNCGEEFTRAQESDREICARCIGDMILLLHPQVRWLPIVNTLLLEIERRMRIDRR